MAHTPATTPRGRRAWLPPFVAGLLAMTSLIGLQEALNSFWPTIPSAASAAAQWIVRLTPGAVTTSMIELLGPLAIRLLTTSVYIGTAVVGGLLAWQAARLWPGRRQLALALLIGVPLLLYLVVAPIQLRSAGELPGALIAGLVGAALFAGLTLLLGRGLQPTLFASPGPAATNRRALLGGGLAAVALLAGGGNLLSQLTRSRLKNETEALAPLAPLATASPAAAAASAPTSTPAVSPTTTSAGSPVASPTAAAGGAAVKPTAPPPPTATVGPSAEELEAKFFAEIKGIYPEPTPIGRHYVVDEAIDDPRVDAKSWKLTIKGLVERPVTLTYDELRALPPVEQHATLMCISYELGQDLLGTAKWRGVRLIDLLKQAGLKPGATHVILRSVDGYDESHLLSKASEPATLLAYGMNDKVLPIQHGFPVRALIPGLYGFKNVKWLTEIEVVSRPHQGYWQRKAGWSPEGFLQGAMSRIDTVDSPPVNVGGEAKVAGIAYAGPSGISKVEVSTDGGETWQPARLKQPLSPFTWRLWAYLWKPQKAGKAALLVRAYEGDGKPQPTEAKPSHPNGSTGLHGFDFDVIG